MLRLTRCPLSLPLATRPRSSLAPGHNIYRPSISRTQPYHATAIARRPYKDAQDRESLKPETTEGTKSGRDSDVAQHDVAFNPNKTSPETQKEDAPGGQLDASGANQDLSKPHGDKPGGGGGHGPGKEVRKGGASGGKSPPKNKGS